jgi:hypothetical protein
MVNLKTKIDSKAALKHKMRQSPNSCLRVHASLSDNHIEAVVFVWSRQNFSIALYARKGRKKGDRNFRGFA